MVYFDKTTNERVKIVKYIGFGLTVVRTRSGEEYNAWHIDLSVVK